MATDAYDGVYQPFADMGDTARCSYELLLMWPFARSVTVRRNEQTWHRAEDGTRQSSIRIVVDLKDVEAQRG